MFGPSPLLSVHPHQMQNKASSLEHFCASTLSLKKHQNWQVENIEGSVTNDPHTHTHTSIFSLFLVNLSHCLSPVTWLRMGFVFWREKLWKNETDGESESVNVPAMEAADTRLVLSECDGRLWIKFSFHTVGVEGAWRDQAQPHFRVME